jgi:zinc/manganese transport system substrate-binding protein
MKWIFCISLLLFSAYSHAQEKINVFACEPEWASLVKELAGDKASIYTATTAFQDPHHIEARPSLIAKVRRADLIVCNGSGLEVGWLPLLLRQSANPKVQPGQAGYFLAGEQVVRLEIPEKVDRSMGDVHAQGNPHVHLDPKRIAVIAVVLSKRLVQLDPINKLFYEQRRNDFLTKWKAAIAKWQQQARLLEGVYIAVNHNSWVYLFDWLGIQQAAILESRPGIPVSASYLAQLKHSLADVPVKMVIYAAYQNDRAAIWLGKEMSIPVVQLPYTVGGADNVVDLFSLFDVTIERLLRALQT